MLIFGTNVGILFFCTASCKRNILDSSTQNHHCQKHGQSIYQNVLASLLSGGSNISVIKMMTSQKKKKRVTAAKEELSCPVCLCGRYRKV